MSTIIIDRDTCTLVLTETEMGGLETVRRTIREIAERVEYALDTAGISDVTVVRDYSTTGRFSTAEGLETLLEGVIVGDVDDIREAVLTTV